MASSVSPFLHHTFQFELNKIIVHTLTHTGIHLNMPLPSLSLSLFDAEKIVIVSMYQFQIKQTNSRQFSLRCIIAVALIMQPKDDLSHLVAI